MAVVYGFRLVVVGKTVVLALFLQVIDATFEKRQRREIEKMLGNHFLFRLALFRARTNRILFCFFVRKHKKQPCRRSYSA